LVKFLHLVLSLAVFSLAWIIGTGKLEVPKAPLVGGIATTFIHLILECAGIENDGAFLDRFSCAFWGGSGYVEVSSS
jgi:hypothetical protein